MEEKDAHLASVLGTRRGAVLSLPWSVQAASDDPRDRKAAELVEEALARIDWEDLLHDLMDAVGKGYSVAEIDWEVSGGLVLPRSVEWVEAKRFRWDGKVLLLVTDEAPQGIPLPANKFVVHRHKARSGLPSRGGMLRVCAWLYLFKNFAVKDWVAFAEVFGMPLRLGKYDPGASKEDRAALETAVRMLGADAAGVIANTTDIEFVTSDAKGSGSENTFGALTEWCDRGMSKAVLGQTLTTDTTGGTGTYAAGSVHNQVRHDLRDADAVALVRTLQRDLVRPIVGFNMGWQLPLPRIEADTSEPEDTKAAAETISVLVKDVGLPVAQAYLYERFGIPAPKKGEAVVGAPAPTALRRQVPAGARVLSGGFTPEQQALESLADASIADAAGAVGTLVDPLVAIVEEATDFDDLRDRILAAYVDLDPSALEDLMARAMFMAELAGRAA
jgi:phage gp29-like protein